MSALQLQRIEIFPIKSLDGVVLEQCAITAGGILEHDRIYAMMDAAGKVVNGKRTARVHQLRAVFNAAVDEVILRDASQAAGRRFALHDLEPLNRWLADFFGFAVTLQRDAERGFPDDRTASGPTITSLASLQTVQTWYPGLTLESLRRRFRCNLELGGGAAFAEDGLFGAPEEQVRFTLGSVAFLGHNPCQRCVVPTRDPEQGLPVADFQKTFMQERQASLPPWASAARFNHFYRFAVNTSVPATEAGKILRRGDCLSR